MGNTQCAAISHHYDQQDRGRETPRSRVRQQTLPSLAAKKRRQNMYKSSPVGSRLLYSTQRGYRHRSRTDHARSSSLPVKTPKTPKANLANAAIHRHCHSIPRRSLGLDRLLRSTPPPPLLASATCCDFCIRPADSPPAHFLPLRLLRVTGLQPRAIRLCLSDCAISTSTLLRGSCS